MSRQRRNFGAKFKSDLVIKLLRDEKDLNTLATENNIQPNLLHNWKKEFLDNMWMSINMHLATAHIATGDTCIDSTIEMIYFPALLGGFNRSVFVLKARKE